MTELGRRHGTTYQTYFLGTTTVQTIDTENIKTVLATKFDDWEITPGRIDSLSTLLGKGIFTTNGLDWRRSHKLVTPNLAREQYKDLGLYDRHLNRLINRIPSDCQTVVDLHDLFLDFTMDTTTELLMGHPVDSQVNLDGVTREFSRPTKRPRTTASKIFGIPHLPGFKTNGRCSLRFELYMRSWIDSSSKSHPPLEHKLLRIRSYNATTF